MANAVLHTPAIYKFPEIKDYRGWGFCKLTDLTEAINTRQRLLNNPLLSPREVLLNFIHLTPRSRGRVVGGGLLVGSNLYCVMDGVGHILESSEIGSIPGPALDDFYVPTGWSQNVLSAIEKGVFLVHLVVKGDNTAIEVALDKNGREISLH